MTLAYLVYLALSQLVEIVHESIYRQSDSIWVADKDHAIEEAEQIRTGRVEVNGGVINPLASFRGYKSRGMFWNLESAS